MIEQVLHPRLNAVIVFARDDDEAIGAAIERRELFEVLRRLPFRMLLVHAVEERQLQLHRIDKRWRVAALFERSHDEIRGANTHAVAPHGAEEDRKVQTHRRLRRLMKASSNLSCSQS